MLNRYESQDDAAKALDGGKAVERPGAAVAEEPHALFSERDEDLVLRRKVAVDRRGTVFDALGDLAHGDVLVALADEEVAGGVENGAPDRFAVAFVAFFDAHGSLDCEQCS